MTTKDASEIQAPGSLQGVSRRTLVKAGIGAIAAPAVLRSIPANAQSRVIKIGHVSPRTGPLAGLPLLVKDLARTVGLPTTFGSHLYADAPADDVDDHRRSRSRARPVRGHLAVRTDDSGT